MSTAQIALFDICASRHRGNAESQAANRKIHSQKRNLQARVYELILSRRGTTLKEVVRLLDIPIQTASARIAELKAQNAIQSNGERREGCAVLVPTYAKESA